MRSFGFAIKYWNCQSFFVAVCWWPYLVLLFLLSNLFLVAFARPQFFDIDVCCSRLLYILIVNSYQILVALLSFLTVVVIVGWLRAMFYDLLTWLYFLLTLPLAFFDNTCYVLLLSLCRICFVRRFINGTFYPHCIQRAGQRHNEGDPFLGNTSVCRRFDIFSRDFKNSSGKRYSANVFWWI